MNIYDLLHNRLLASDDIIGSSYDKCVVCCFIYCCLPFLELSEQNNDFRESYHEYPENFFHMNLT
jgi:hypothetical protein